MHHHLNPHSKTHYWENAIAAIGIREGPEGDGDNGDRIAERRSEISGLTIGQDDLSDFACKKCTAALDKFTRIQTAALKMKTELANQPQ